MGSWINYEISKSDDYITMENLHQQIEQLKQEIDLLKKENERLRSQADFWFKAANISVATGEDWTDKHGKKKR